MTRSKACVKPFDKLREYVGRDTGFGQGHRVCPYEGVFNCCLSWRSSLRMGQSAKARTKGKIILAMGTSISKPRAQQ